MAVMSEIKQSEGVADKGENAISPEATRDQLEKIVASDEFAKASRNKQLLRFLVVEALEGRSSDLRGYQIGVAVFDRASDFDPQLDPIVRTQAHRLRHALDRYYLKEGAFDPVKIRVLKGQYVPEFLANRAVDESVGPSGFGPMDVAHRRGLPAIAVLPFSILSAGKGDDIASIGLAEELVHAFSVFPDLKVTSSFSAQASLEPQMLPVDVGKRLGVDYIVHGTLRQSQSTVRITVELLDTLDGTNLMSERYEYELSATSVFDVQDDIVRRCVARIADDYGAISRAFAATRTVERTSELVAYEAIMTFQKYNYESTSKTWAAAKSALEKAVEIDPDYARAWSFLAEIHCDNYGLGFADDPDTLDKAVIYADRAIKLDPVCQHAHFVKSYVHFLKRETDEFKRTVAEAIAFNPNAAYIVGFSGFLMAMSGDWEGGLHILRESEDLNPYHPPFFSIARCLDAYRRGDYLAAKSEAAKVQMERLPWGHLLRAITSKKLGNQEEAIRAYERLLEVRPEFSQDRGGARAYLRAYIHEDSLVDELVKDLNSILS